jgi:hypothetical protein
MAQFIVTITVALQGKGCKLKKVVPMLTPVLQPGDDIVWTVAGNQGLSWVVIGDFTKKVGTATCPMDQPYYGIGPGQGSVVGRVNMKRSVPKGNYKYWVRARLPMAIGTRAAKPVPAAPTMPNGGSGVLDAPLILLSQADADLDPEIQIGG